MAAWPVPADELDVQTPQGVTRVRVSGGESGVPVVLLPGVGSSSLMFAAAAAPLALSFRVYAVDNIHDVGMSRNDQPFTETVHFTDWLAALLDALGLSRVVLVGVSYGGWIAAEFAQRHPGRLAGLVLVAPANTVAPLSMGFIVRAVSCALPGRGFTARFMRWLAADAVAAGGPAAAEVDHAIEGGFLGIRSFVNRRVVPPQLQAPSQLAALPEGTLFLCGENERIFDPQAARLALEAAPQITQRWVEGVGHDLVLLRPDALVDAVSAASTAG